MVVDFADFRLDVEGGELLRGGKRVSLQPQPFRVLSLLAAHPGRLVTREEIRAQIWPGDTFVDFEQGLNYCIKQIRAALDDDARSPRFVETRPRLGYRFIAAIDQPRTEPAPSGRVMLAVLPFENLSDSDEQEFFVDGLTDELITELSRLNAERLAVIARTSTTQYKRTSKSIATIGRELHVSFVLEGTVRRAGARVRVTAQLVQASDQTHVWAETYERSLDDVFALQSAIARAIAREIRVKLTPDEETRLASARPARPEAYDAYLKGRYFWNKRTQESLGKSIACFTEAVAADPGYAAAYAGLADCYLRLLDSSYMGPAEACARAREAAVRALAIDGRLAEAHTALGHRAMHLFEWKEAEASFERALASNAGYGTAYYYYANYLAAVGRFDRAMECARRGLELDPLALPVILNTAFVMHLARRSSEAQALAERALELDPSFLHVHYHLGLVHEQMGLHAAAIEDFTRSIGRGPGTIAALGRAYGLAGDRERALACLGELQTLASSSYVSPYDVALVLLALGDLDETFASLERAYAERAGGLVFVKSDPRLERLHRDPRFQVLVRRMGFPA